MCIGVSDFSGRTEIIFQILPWCPTGNIFNYQPIVSFGSWRISTSSVTTSSSKATTSFSATVPWVSCKFNTNSTPLHILSVQIRNGIICVPGKTKLGRDVGHDRNSRPSIVFTFIRDDFLTNQNTYATKTLRRNCDWRWPELLPATDTHFKGQRYRLPTFTEVEPDVLAVSQPNKDLGQLPALQLLFSCKFVLRVQPHTVIIRLKAICLLRLLIVLPSTPQIPPISFALHPLTVMMVPQLRLQCRTPP